MIRFTELSRENVVNCLRVLIHQNCVQAFAVQQEGSLLLCINLIDCKGRNYFITCFDPSVSVDEEKGFFATLSNIIEFVHSRSTDDVFNS